MSNRVLRAIAAVLVLTAAFAVTAGGPARAALVETDVVVTGAGPGGGPHVRLWNTDGSDTGIGFFAYDPGFRGGVDVVMADVTGDGTDEIITGAGPGGGPHVRVFSSTGTALGGFFPYAVGFTGGVFVGAAQIDEDDAWEIVTGAGAGGGPHVKIFDWSGSTGTEARSFFPFDPAFKGGVQATGVWTDPVATTQNIVAAAGPGGGPHVRVVTATGSPTPTSFFPYATDFRGGVNVAVADLNGDDQSEIITGPGPGGGPHVRAFNTDGTPHPPTNFFAYASTFRGGADVGGYYQAADALSESIVTGAGPGGGPHVKGFNENNTTTALSLFAYASNFTGGVRVAGGLALVDDGT